MKGRRDCGEGFGEGSGEWSERVTTQDAAMIRPETVAPSRVEWAPIEKSIHTPDKTPTPCHWSVTSPVTRVSVTLSEPVAHELPAQHVRRSRGGCRGTADRAHDFSFLFREPNHGHDAS